MLFICVFSEFVYFKLFVYFQFMFYICVFSDVVYDKEVIPSLVRILLKVLKPKKNNVPIAYIASTVRNEDTRDFFLINLGKKYICTKYIVVYNFIAFELL